jgi:hypothetical protein
MTAAGIFLIGKCSKNLPVDIEEGIKNLSTSSIES